MTVTDRPDSSAGEPPPPDLDMAEIARARRRAPYRLVDDPPVDPEWEDWAANHLEPIWRPRR